MKNKDVCFPYPVLGVGDDVGPKPSVKPKINEEKDDFVIHIDLEMLNEDILELIRNEYAVFTCEIDCPSTFYRRILYSTEPAFDIRINRKDAGRASSIDIVLDADFTDVKQWGTISEFHAKMTKELADHIVYAYWDELSNFDFSE